MNRTYVYRKHLRVSFKFLVFLELVMLLVIVMMLFGLIITNDHNFKGTDFIIFAVVVLFIIIIFTGEMGLMYLVLFKRFKSIRVTLTDASIIYTNAKGQHIIRYEDIVKLEFPSIKYAGGWVKIIYKGGNIRLTVVLEHIGDFIYALKDQLDERKMESVYNEKKIFSFFKTAVFSDESWERIYHNLKLQLGSHLLCILTTIVILMINKNVSSSFWIFGSLFAPLIGYLLSEIIIGSKVKKRVGRDELILYPRNIKFEQNIFKVSIIGFTAAFLILLLIVVIL